MAVIVGTKSIVANGLAGGNGKVSLKSRAIVSDTVAASNVTVGTKAVAGDVTADGNVAVKVQATTLET